ncbi:HAD family hydrolase [Aeromonas veronii]|uniref:HAD family hydrolase n=1 Tax=Aeromonas veronii TaxID=654 RepID=UPI003D234D68
MKLDAILWDYDGTLVNSVPKNIDITKQILAEVAPHLTGEHLPRYLRSEAEYHHANHAAKNWQALYMDYYGLSRDEMVLAGSLWAKHQEMNRTEVLFFAGLEAVIDHFSAIPHGICSQNSQKNIRRVLELHGVNSLFKAVVGYDDVPGQQQKPHPFGGLKCLESIFGPARCQSLIYIGDHEADVQFARHLQAALGEQSRVISVAVAYSRATPERWEHQPDHIARDVEDLLPIVGQYL